MHNTTKTATKKRAVNQVHQAQDTGFNQDCKHKKLQLMQVYMHRQVTVKVNEQY